MKNRSQQIPGSPGLGTFEAAPCLILILMSVVFTISNVAAQDSTESPLKPIDWFSGSVIIGGTYNDNIIGYSPSELSQFNDGLRPSKFAINNSTDVVNSIKLRLGASPRLFSDAFRSTLRLRYANYQYRSNAIRSYHSWAGELKQSLWTRNYVSLQFSSLPEYYLRNLQYRRYRIPSRLPSHYAQESFSRNEFGFEVGRRFNSHFALALNYTHGRSLYNQEFEERSNTAHTITLESDYKVARAVKVNIDYSYAIVWADGRQDFTNPAYDSLADISSQSNRVVLGALINLKQAIGLPVNVQERLTYERQGYLSGKAGDIFHNARVDHYWRFSTELSYELGWGLQVNLQYAWEQNRTNLSVTNEAGSYQAHEVGVGLEYDL